jgi:putative FmdB family regulatory protein
MPIYEYKCCDCETVFEVFTSLNGAQTPCCSKCKSTHVKKIISKLGFIKHPVQSCSCSSEKSGKQE